MARGGVSGTVRARQPPCGIVICPPMSGWEQPSDRAVFAERVRDYALATLFKAQHSPVAKRSGRLSEANPAGAARGRAAFDSISRDSFSRMAEECAVAPKLVLGRLDYIAKRIVPAASRLADECNARFPSKVYKQILSVIQQRLSRICLPRSLR